MKVFYALHDGVWLGGKSVVVAASADAALEMVKADLLANHLKVDGIELVELDLSRPRTIMIDNGDY